MRVSHKSYQEYIKRLDKELAGASLFTPIFMNNETLLFPLQEDDAKSLVISLNHSFPLMYLIKDRKFYSSFENPFYQKLKKYIQKPTVNSIKLFDNDMIAEIDVIVEDEIDEKEYQIFVELIPTKPNLVITDTNNFIIESFYKDKNRNLQKGAQYEMPIQKGEPINGDEISNSLICSQYEGEILNRRKERYQSFSNFVNGKIKQAKRKISAIENDVKIANENLRFEDIGNSILCLGLNMKTHQSEIKVENEVIKFDESKTILENVEHFFKKAKKAKETIVKSNENISNANKEIEAYNEILDKFNQLNEKDADRFMNEIGMNKKKKEVNATIFNQPFKINLNGTIIYFGKNASQNDYLSFVMKLDREFTWLHLKDKPGAHLVIANTKPTDAELTFAAELSVHCSHQMTGEVIFTKKKNVRRGHTLGEAIIKNYQTIIVNNVSDRVKEEHSKAIRVK